MSITRQQKRAMKRKLGGITDEQAERMIQAIQQDTAEKKKAAEEMTSVVSGAVYEKIKKQFEPEIQARAAGEVITMFISFLHIDRHHTGQYLRRLIHEFNEFADDIKAGGGTTDDLRQILMDECKLDLVEEFRQCEFETIRRAKEKGRRIS